MINNNIHKSKCKQKKDVIAYIFKVFLYKRYKGATTSKSIKQNLKTNITISITNNKANVNMSSIFISLIS